MKRKTLTLIITYTSALVIDIRIGFCYQICKRIVAVSQR